MAEATPRIRGFRDVPPDPSIASAVGRHHTFETAIADLVDNSIDAGASRVLVRLLERDGAIVGLRLIDDGKGMGSDTIDAAMTFARKRDYGSGDLGHFGLGLKAASLSQADVLRVFSQSHGVPPVGRVLESSTPTKVGELDGDDVAGVLTDLRVDFPFITGTVVEWDRPRTFLTTADDRDRSRWVEERISSVLAHLGIVFHRKIATGSVKLTVEVFDTGYGEAGIPRTVDPIDPFGYDRLPNDHWPKPLAIAIDGATTNGLAHLWPAAQSGRREFRLAGKPGTLAQGFYFYRGDRLLQIGGWNTLTVEKPELEYARVAIDLDDVLAAHVTINPEKAGLELDADLRQALHDASVGTDGDDFASYLGQAQEQRRLSRTYTKRPVTLVEPDRGFDADMIAAFADSVEYAAAEPVDIRWRVERTEAPVSIDIERRTIWLNESYRDVIVGRDRLDAADAPFVKTLLMIVYSKYFEGTYLGSREKAELAAWEQLLTAALRDEIAKRAQEIGVTDE